MSEMRSNPCDEYLPPEPTVDNVRNGLNDLLVRLDSLASYVHKLTIMLRSAIDGDAVRTTVEVAGGEPKLNLGAIQAVQVAHREVDRIYALLDDLAELIH